MIGMGTRLVTRCTRKWLTRNYSGSSNGPLHVCIVGSGPAGFYTAEKMLKRHKQATVDIIERLPTPFGLVRSGVAPDHPETKNLSGIHSAREFVWWYNGHPDCTSLPMELQNTDTAVVLGQGNVALDVARILLRPINELATTDIAEYALAALEKSCIRKVYLVGRRGPVQAACTAKELREILGMQGMNVHVQEEDLLTSPLDEEEMKRGRSQRRVYELFCKAARSRSGQQMSAADRELHFVFLRKPERFLHSIDERRVAGVRLEKTFLKGDDVTGHQHAFGTGELEDIGCGLVLKSIGYKSLLVDELPFDHSKGIVPNFNGRVLMRRKSEETSYENGLYVVGWLKRGPTGIIGTNLFCAEETVESISEDFRAGILDTCHPLQHGRMGLVETLQRNGVRYVSFKDWEKIDTKEKELGSMKGKPREKITSWQELLNVANE